MNHQMLLYLAGWLLRIEGCFLLAPLLTALLYRESVWIYYFALAVALLASGFVLCRKKPVKRDFFEKDGFVLVALAWVVLSLFGALPFYLAGEVPCYTDAMFEMVSGFTTTGASIMPNVDEISYASRLWRSLSHWIGGMGILVFMLAVLPMTGENSMSIMRAESPGPSVGKLVPKIRTTAATLYRIYLFMTILMFVILALAGMPVFDNLCMTFGTAGTGGFSCRSTGQAEYTLLQQFIIGVFMTVFAVNFNVYFFLRVRRFRDALGCEEMHGFLWIVGVAILLITINIFRSFSSVPLALHHAAFTVSSIISTTGYMTVDFDQWPEFSKCILLALMMIGGCAGSTAGGIKVSRVMISAKQIGREIETVVHPRRVKVLRFEQKGLSYEMLRSLNTYMLLYGFVMVISIVLVSLDGHDLMTTVSSVFTALNNVGPGLSLAGPTRNFAFYSSFSKWVLIFDMLAGRLELFPIFVLLSPSTWTKH